MSKPFEAIYHGAAGLAGKPVAIEGSTREEVLRSAQTCYPEAGIAGRYLQKIRIGSCKTTVWIEDRGWVEAADALLPS